MQLRRAQVRDQSSGAHLANRIVRFRRLNFGSIQPLSSLFLSFAFASAFAVAVAVAFASTRRRARNRARAHLVEIARKDTLVRYANSSHLPLANGFVCVCASAREQTPGRVGVRFRLLFVYLVSIFARSRAHLCKLSSSRRFVRPAKATPPNEPNGNRRRACWKLRNVCISQTTTQPTRPRRLRYASAQVRSLAKRHAGARNRSSQCFANEANVSLPFVSSLATTSTATTTTTTTTVATLNSFVRQCTFVCSRGKAARLVLPTQSARTRQKRSDAAGAAPERRPNDPNRRQQFDAGSRYADR